MTKDLRWKDACKRHMNTVGISTVESINRATWKLTTTPMTPREREKPGKKKTQGVMHDKIIASHTCFGGHMDFNC